MIVSELKQYLETLPDDCEVYAANPYAEYSSNAEYKKLEMGPALDFCDVIGFDLGCKLYIG